MLRSKRDAEKMRHKNQEIERKNQDLLSKQELINQLNANLEVKVRERTLSLQNSERLLHEAQRIAKLGSYVLDIPTGQWQSSPMLDELLGIDENYQRTKQGWSTLIHPEDRDNLTADFKGGACLSGKNCDEQYRIITHDLQAERWVHEIGQMELDAQGRPLKMLGTLQDVTDYKALLEELHAVQERERELRAQKIMEKLGTDPQGLPALQALGAQSLRETQPGYFTDLVQRFGKLMDLSLEQTVLRVNHAIGVELLKLAQELGQAESGPRDVIDMYVHAIKMVSVNVPTIKANAYADEARLMVLELMGYLVTFYRRQHSLERGSSDLKKPISSGMQTKDKP